MIDLLSVIVVLVGSGGAALDSEIRNVISCDFKVISHFNLHFELY